jgi:hypothetical protein
LAHRLCGKDLIDQQRRGLGYAPGSATRRSDRPRHEDLLPALGGGDADEVTMRRFMACREWCVS